MAAPTGAFAGTFADDFSTGLDPSDWSVIQTTPGLYSVDDTQGDVRLAKVGTNPGGFQNIAVVLNLGALTADIPGDFSMQIDFANALIGPNNDRWSFTLTSRTPPFSSILTTTVEVARMFTCGMAQ